MIDLERNVIRQNGREENIERFEVWFQTVIGYCQSKEQAVAVCKEMDLNPNLTIRFIPVAVGATLWEPCG